LGTARPPTPTAERRPARGRQFTTADSPDGAWTAISENGNLYLQPKSDGKDGAPAAARVAITTDGNDDIKYGQASWVYGEELDQTTAMWWSQDSRFLAFYRFDESKVKDFLLVSGWTETNTRMMTEAYPKPGQPNPTASLLVHDLETKKTVAVDSFSAKSGANDGTEYYVYNVLWAPGGGELLYSRTPRRQDTLQVLAADPRTGASRLVVEEKQESWQDNRPLMRFLKDGKRFIWETEKTGFKHFELRALDGKLISTITAGDWPAERIVPRSRRRRRSSTRPTARSRRRSRRAARRGSRPTGSRRASSSRAPQRTARPRSTGRSPSRPRSIPRRSTPSSSTPTADRRRASSPTASTRATRALRSDSSSSPSTTAARLDAARPSKAPRT